MKAFKIIKDAIIVLFLSVIAGIVLLILAFLVPTDFIRSNVYNISDALSKEEDRYCYFFDMKTSGIDNYTDIIMLDESLFGIDGDINNLRYVLDGNVYIAEDTMDMTDQLPMFTNHNYFDKLRVVPLSKRFWNGYLVPLKFCLTQMHYYELRYLNMFIHLILTSVLCGLLYKRKMIKYAIPVVLAYIWLNPVTMSMCLTFSAFYYCIVIPCIVMLALHDKLKVGHRYLLFFEGIGICTIYFCVNYIQLLALIFPLSLYILLNEKEVTGKELVKKCLWIAFFWFVGYYGMMAAKWVVYGIFIDWSIFGEIVDNVLFRLSSEDKDYEFDRFTAISRNISTAFSDNINNFTEYFYILVCLIVILKKRINSFPKVYIAIFALSCAVPLVRYFIFANHVYIHYWVMYKLMVIPIYCLNVILIRIVTDNKAVEAKKLREECAYHE